MTNVGNGEGENTGSAELSDVEQLRREVKLLQNNLHQLRLEITTEVRSRSVLVVDAEGLPVIELRADGDAGRLVVGGVHGRVLIEAGPRTSAGIDVTSGELSVEVGVHLRADVAEQSAVVALSGHGDVVGEYHLLGDEDTAWRVEHVEDLS